MANFNNYLTEIFKKIKFFYKNVFTGLNDHSFILINNLQRFFWQKLREKLSLHFCHRYGGSLECDL